MKNKTVKMILAVAVLAVCCGAYAGVKTYVSHQEQKESEAESEENTSVFTASADDIKSLDFMVDDTETTFEKKDDSWVKKDDTDFPVNQSTLDSAASSVTSVESDRVLEDVDDLAEYGLDSPANTIKIVTKSEDEDGDDTTTTLYVGDENSSTSQYYVRKDDDEKTVYLVDSSCVEPFTKTLYDYAQMEDFPAISSTDTITKISVDGDNSYELKKDADTSVWSVSANGEEDKADSATVSSLVSSFGSMAYNSMADYKCEDKSKYGLDKPYSTITVDYQEEAETSDDNAETSDSETPDSAETTEMVDKQLTILVGNEADDSNRYVMVNDSNEVYTMSEETLSALTDKTEEDFWDMTVSYVSVNSLAGLKVNYQGTDYKVNASRETSTDEDGNDTETVTYKLDGADLDETTFTTFYNKLINMAAQKRLTEKYDPDGDAELTVTFTEEDGDTLEVSYYSYDTNYYAAVVDNKVYLVNKMNVKELFTAFESVAGVEKDETKTDSDEVESDEKASADVETDSETETSDNSDAVTDDDSKSASASDTTDTSESDTEEEENVNKDHSNSIIFWNCYKKASIHRNKSVCRSFLCLRTTL